MPGKNELIECTILFLLTFGLHHGVNFIFSASPFLVPLEALALFATALGLIVFMKVKNCDFGKHGFLVPQSARRLLAMTLFLAVLSIVIVLFIPGAISGFEAVPSPPISLNLMFSGGSVLLASVATEMVFQGYIQTSLADAYDFNDVIIVVSIMFAMYMLPIALYLTLDPVALFLQSLPLFAEGVFLCFLFRETETLLCPIAFTTTIVLLGTFTPLEAMASDSTTLLTIVTYLALTPIMKAFVSDVKQQTARLDDTPIVESE